jgi:integral membrane protein (TIGR00529 family)
MSFLDHIPAILRIALAFILILVAIRNNISLGNALTAGALVLGLAFGLGPLQILKSALISVSHPKTLALAVIVMLILVLSHSMEVAGQMNRLLDNFRGLVKRPSLNIIVFPALIGLLPMPGGAIFSAPMVKNLGHRHLLKSDQLSYVNYWFRHIWEYWWPLYPGVLLTTTIAGLNLWCFVLALFPLTLVALMAGYRPLRGALAESRSSAAEADRAGLRPFLAELSPVLVVIFVGLGLGILLSALTVSGNFAIAKESGLVVALIMAISSVWYTNRFTAARVRTVIVNPKLLGMFYMVTSILIFKGILEDSRAIEAVSRELMRWHVPLVPITMLLPFLVGGVAGITIAFVGTTFPILISLIQTMGHGHLLLPYMMLALVSGFVGVLLSPLHLCLLLSNAYFKTTLAAVYRLLWQPCTILILAAGFYFELMCVLLGR